ncbi:MAG TPA: hypothetical protein VFT31_17115 [Kribbella sp.]|nr:hypothetical protein [Kribbella sp.]
MPESLRRLGDVTQTVDGTRGMQAAWAGAWPDAEHTLATLAVTMVRVGRAARFFR